VIVGNAPLEGASQRRAILEVPPIDTYLGRPSRTDHELRISKFAANTARPGPGGGAVLDFELDRPAQPSFRIVGEVAHLPVIAAVELAIACDRLSCTFGLTRRGRRNA